MTLTVQELKEKLEDYPAEKIVLIRDTDGQVYDFGFSLENSNALFLDVDDTEEADDE